MSLINQILHIVIKFSLPAEGKEQGERGSIAPPLFVHELTYPVLGYFKLLIYNTNSKFVRSH